MMTLKVGELADRAGLTVRTLHHYDEIGLLTPARRSSSGHRLYETPQIARLQQIKSLQQLGFPLGEIAALLATEDFSPLHVVRMHLQRAQEQLGNQQQLVDRLQRIAVCLESAEEPSAEMLLQSIEVMTMFDKYYTPEQMQYLEERRAAVGEDRMQAAQEEWQQLYAAAEREMKKGTDPADEAVQRLVRKSQELIAEFTGGDAGVKASLTEMWNREPEVRQKWGPPPEVWEYLKKAGEAAP